MEKKSQKRSDEENKTNLEKLRQLALQRGANDAVVILASDIILDPRVRLKCMIPKCYMSGRCDHCPPHGFSIKEMNGYISRFQWAMFFRVIVESQIIAAKGISNAMSAGIMDNEGNLLNLGAKYILISTTTKLLQKRAKEMGYEQTLGFAGGNCHDMFCFLQPTCQALLTKRGCRNDTLSSPSMEACGMDAFLMAAHVGWDVYPIGGTCEPDSVPSGSLMGLVLVI
jgi:predicted metal-binding protein